jgi:hypothetical protein
LVSGVAVGNRRHAAALGRIWHEPGNQRRIFALAGFNQLGVGVSWGKFDFRMIARAVADSPKSTINQRRSSIVNRSGHGAAGSWD